jgi:dipeptidyl aminopeptidase/acylaminoacyl peptidase
MQRRFTGAAPRVACVLSLALAAAAAQAALVLDGVPPQSDAALAARLAPWLESRGASLEDFLPGGGMLVRTRFGDTEQLHRVAAPLGAREQLTFVGASVGAASVPRVAAPVAIAFEQGGGGDADVQVRSYRFADRRIRTLSDGRARNGGPVWSRDGRRVAFHGNARDLASDDIYVADATVDGAARLLLTGLRRRWRALDWSPDDAKLLLLDAADGPDGGLFVADVASAALTGLSIVPAGEEPPRRPAASIYAARFSADGRGVWVASDASGGEFARLGYIDVASGQWRAQGEEPAADVEEIAVSPDGRYVATLSNAGGTGRVTALDLGLRREIVATKLPAGVVRGLRFDAQGKRLGMTIESSQSPPDAWTWEIEPDVVVQWTRSEGGPVDPARLAVAQAIRLPAWDRGGGQSRQLAAWVYRPSTPGPHPVVIQLDGGTGGQSRPDFDAFRQFLVAELGHVVIAPNVRGSSGYGRSWAALGSGEYAQDAVRDIGSVLVWIAAQRDLDPKRVAILGGPRGGELALASLAAYGDRIQRGVDMGGVGASSHATSSTRRAANGTTSLGGVASIVRPVLVVRGWGFAAAGTAGAGGVARPFPPLLDAGTIGTALRRNGREVWIVDARGESAGYPRKADRDAAYRVVAGFLSR